MIFFDRDETLIEDVPYNSDPSLIIFKPDVISTLLQLKNKYKFIIITNQSGVARGLLTIGQVELFMNSLIKIFRQNGIPILDYYYSPYYQLNKETSNNQFDRTSNCRKPGADLIKLAAREHLVDMSLSYLVGDRESDLLAAFNAGLKPIIVNYRNLDLEYKTDFQYTEIKEFRMLIDVIK